MPFQSESGIICWKGNGGIREQWEKTKPGRGKNCAQKYESFNEDSTSIPEPARREDVENNEAASSNQV